MANFYVGDVLFETGGSIEGSGDIKITAICDCTNSVGTAGQILSSTGTALEWIAAPSGAAAATPTTLGVLFGCTTNSAVDNTVLGYQACGATATRGVYVGYQAGCSDAGDCNTVVGYQAALGLNTGINNVSLGYLSMGNLAIGSNNTALGCGALYGTAAGGFVSNNTGVGAQALCGVCGTNNVAIGACAGCTVTGSSSCNVIIGPSAQPLLTTGNCQLAIGFSATDNWLTGDGTKAIKPGAGIIDCAGSTGTSGQVLTSNGSNAVQWATASGGGGFTDLSGSLTSTTNGTKVNLVGWTSEDYTNYIGQFLIYVVYAVNPGEPLYNMGSNAIIMLNAYNGPGSSTVQPFSTASGTFAVEGIIYPAYSDVTITYTPSITTSEINFFIQYLPMVNGAPSLSYLAAPYPV